MRVSNKHGRVRELKDQIGTILQRGNLNAAEAAQLRGRLVFANSQLLAN